MARWLVAALSCHLIYSTYIVPCAKSDMAELPDFTPVNVAKPQRLKSIDLLRGFVMVLMALDHVRDFFTNVRFDPLDLSQTTPGLFLTRWITHFCAPTFVFLAGTGAFLSLGRGKTKSEVSRFLLTRGIWLVVIELTWVRFGWLFNLDYSLVILQVIWALGWSMVVLAGLVHLSMRTIVFFSVGMIAFHNLLDPINPGPLGIFGWTWQILHWGNDIQWGDGNVIFAGYPLIPWVGVMAAGYACGAVLQKPEHERKKTLVRLGVGLIACFVLLRGFNIYGDGNHWHSQSSLLFTAFSFIDCVKYPPSLLFLMMTLGPAILSLVYLERAKGPLASFFITFGRVPFFFYVIHIPVIHGLAVIAASLSGYEVGYMFDNVPPWLWPEGYGFALFGVYAVWVGIVAVLYPLCRWFAEVKGRRKENWLSYL
jgi:uncharacterized membrane protein